MEDLNQSQLDLTQIGTLQKVNCTLVRSKKIVQESKQLTKKYSQRKIGGKENQRELQIVVQQSCDNPKIPYQQDSRIKNFNEQSQKQNYTRILQDLRIQITDIQQKRTLCTPKRCNSLVYRKEEDKKTGLKRKVSISKSLIQQNQFLKQKIHQIQNNHQKEILQLNLLVQKLTKQNKIINMQCDELKQQQLQIRNFKEKYSQLQSQIVQLKNELSLCRESSLRISQLQQHVADLQNKSKQKAGNRSSLEEKLFSFRPIQTQPNDQNRSISVSVKKKQANGQIAQTPKNTRSSSIQIIKKIKNKSPFLEKVRKKRQISTLKKFQAKPINSSINKSFVQKN